MRGPKKVLQHGQATCIVCRATFYYESRRIPATCGAPYCRAMHDWTDEEWEGAARMATARKAADRQIITWISGHDADYKPIFAAKIIPAVMTPTDLEALRRHP